MVNIIITTIALSSVWIAFGQKNITEVFPLKWKTPIGITTYRTNIVEHEGLIYIGSNGEDRLGRMDQKDGVYAIDKKTGKVIHQYTMAFGGDNDVTGIAIGDGKLFFGTDNFYFFCFDLKTHKELWKYHLPFDVESCPVLEDFNGDKILDAAFSVQDHGFYALNGINGELIWLNNQISSYNGNVSPLLLDVNEDGVKDMITSGEGHETEDLNYGFYHYALDGKTGKVIWSHVTSSEVNASPFISTKNGKVEIYFIDTSGELIVLDKTGKLVRYAALNIENCYSPYLSKDDHLILGDRSYDFSAKNFDRDSDTSHVYLAERAYMNYFENTYRTSATSMVADVLGKGSMQMLCVTEYASLFIAKTDCNLIQELKMPAGAEASLYIKDIDGDGKLEFLVASLDGYLYCYETNSKGKVEYGKFR